MCTFVGLCEVLLLELEFRDVHLEASNARWILASLFFLIELQFRYVHLEASNERFVSCRLAFFLF